MELEHDRSQSESTHGRGRRGGTANRQDCAYTYALLIQEYNASTFIGVVLTYSRLQF